MARNRFIVFLCLLASLTACNKSSDSENGLIFMWFDVEGVVVDTDGNPIKGISVYAESADVVTTGSDGRFSVHGGGVPSSVTVIRFVDKDITDNVTYTAKSVSVELEKYKNGQGWTEGFYRNRYEVVVVMHEDVPVTPPSPDVGS